MNNHRLQQTVEAMFNQKTAPSGMFRISQGMQFERPGAQFVWLFVMLLLIISIVLMINSHWLIGTICLLLLPLPIAYIIDIRGFEIDFKNSRIRNYQSLFGIRTGEWMPLSSFDSIRVYLHELKTTRGKFINRGPKKYDTYSYYYVRLVSEGLRKSISLLELNSYDRAKYQAEKVARSASLRFIEKPARIKADKV